MSRLDRRTFLGSLAAVGIAPWVPMPVVPPGRESWTYVTREWCEDHADRVTVVIGATDVYERDWVTDTIRVRARQWWDVSA